MGEYPSIPCMCEESHSKRCDANLTPRDGQTNWQMRIFSSTPHSFRFPNVKSVCLFTGDRSNSLPLLFCLDDHVHELNFVLLGITSLTAVPYVHINARINVLP